jgi:hypothetical protein
MDEDFEFNDSFLLFPGVDLTLWLNIAIAVVLGVGVVIALLLMT